MLNQAALAGFREAIANIRNFLPQVAAGVGLALAGWLLGRLLGRLSRRLTERIIARLGQQAWVNRTLEGARLASTFPAVIGRFVFWLVFLFFLAAAVESVGLPVVTTILSRFAYYLPNVLAAVLIVLAGVFAGNITRHWITRTTTSAGLVYGAAVSRAVQIAIVMVALVVAIEEVGIEGQLLVILVAIVIGSALASAGMAFGLGARTAVSNIIARHYLGQSYRVGQLLRIGDVHGRVLSTTSTAVILETDEGRMLIPAKRFSEEISVLLPEAQRS